MTIRWNEEHVQFTTCSQYSLHSPCSPYSPYSPYYVTRTVAKGSAVSLSCDSRPYHVTTILHFHWLKFWWRNKRTIWIILSIISVKNSMSNSQRCPKKLCLNKSLFTKTPLFLLSDYCSTHQKLSSEWNMIRNPRFVFVKMIIFICGFFTEKHYLSFKKPHYLHHCFQISRVLSWMRHATLEKRTTIIMWTVSLIEICWRRVL